MSTLFVDTLEPNQNTAITAAAGKLLPAGHVVQIQQGLMNARVQVTTTSEYTIGNGFTVNITPSSTSSKILVMPMLTSIVRTTALINLYIYRDSTKVTTLGWYHGNSNWGALLMGGNFLDSPSTTSQITYSCKFRVDSLGPSGGPYLNYNSVSLGGTNDDSRSSITAMEIAQ